MIRIALLAALMIFSVTALAGGEWNGKKAAVALTYDDSLNVHIDHARPDLNKYGLKGTFYITVGFDGFPERLEEWREMAAEGHELGNHTLFHPCDASMQGRDWVAADRDMSQWSSKRVLEGIEVANTALRALDGKDQRTFAYPCGDMKAKGGESYVELIKDQFVGARGVHKGFEKIGDIELFDIRSYMINGESAKELKGLVDEAIERGALVVFLFHGVGGEHGLDVSRENHQALVKYLNKKKDQVWVAPMVEIAQFVKEKQAEKSKPFYGSPSTQAPL